MEPDPIRAGMDDPDRIEAARRLLAQAPGEAIDRLAALSARLLGAAHSQVWIFTDEPVSLTPRPASAHELAARTFAGEAATPASGAYLGTPIEVDDVRVGVLCVHDTEPFEWTPHDVDVLRELAGAIAAELERGALAAELEASTVRLDLAFAAASIGGFDWDLRTDELHWDDRLMELFGYTKQTWVAHIEKFNVRVHPDDRERVAAAIAHAVGNRGEYAAEYRVVHDDGTVRWVAARGRVMSDEDGEPERMLGAAYDTTSAQIAAERLGRMLESMSIAFLTLYLEGRLTYVNGAAERMLGRSREELVGERLDPGPEAESADRRALETGEPQSFELYHPSLDRWFDARAAPSAEGLSVSYHDITSRVRAEQDAARLAGEREEALAASGAATGRLQILSTASARLAGTLEVEELLQILSDVVLNGFGSGIVVAVADRVLQDGATGNGFQIALGEGTGDRLPASALATGPGVYGDVPSLTLPLVSRGRMLGALIVLEPVDSALDRRVLVELAARAGVALDNAVLFGAEKRLALTLQRSLLPAGVPDLPGIELATRYLPGTGGRDVGGDFYIAHPLEDGRLLLVIGDVMGHGAQAAARMGQLRAVLAAYAYDGDPPDRVLAHLSVRAPALLDLPMATVLVGIYDPPSRVLTFALAGHLPPLVAPLDAEPAFVPAAPGPPLGVGTADYERHLAEIPAGATVVLYTDGLIEDRRWPIDQGMEALRRALIEMRLPPEAVCDHVLGALGRRDGAEDDIALLIMNHSG
jgi:PAS domain S-box-containing protein